MQSESEVRLNQGSNYNRQQNRFSNFNPRERGRFPDAAAQHPNTYDRCVSREITVKHSPQHNYNVDVVMGSEMPYPQNENIVFFYFIVNFGFFFSFFLSP